jgi:hypothetical protein
LKNQSSEESAHVIRGIERFADWVHTRYLMQRDDQAAASDRRAQAIID